MMDFVTDFSFFSVVLVVVLLFMLGLYIWSIIWAFRDAEKRGKPGWAIALLVAIFSWPISLLFWYAFRPDLKVNEPANS